MSQQYEDLAMGKEAVEAELRKAMEQSNGRIAQCLAAMEQVYTHIGI